jgi:hypothetical protein
MKIKKSHINEMMNKKQQLDEALPLAIPAIAKGIGWGLTALGVADLAKQGYDWYYSDDEPASTSTKIDGITGATIPIKKDKDYTPLPGGSGPDNKISYDDYQDKINKQQSEPKKTDWTTGIPEPGTPERKDWYDKHNKAYDDTINQKLTDDPTTITKTPGLDNTPASSQPEKSPNVFDTFKTMSTPQKLGLGAGALGVGMLARNLVKKRKKKKEKKNENYIKLSSKQISMLNEAISPLQKKKLKKELDNSLKGIRKNNFSISREFNKVNRTKSKQAMSLYKRYIIEYQIRMHKLLREL